MLIEVHRFRQRFLRLNVHNPGGAGILILTLLCYLMLLLLVVQAKGDVPPMVLVMLQAGVITFLCPVALYNAIAGEREKRTWDVLLVAPVTKGQIVVGKFIAGLAMVLAITVAFLIPIVISGVLHATTRWGSVLQGELLTIAYGALLCSWTILMSARVKRGLMALGTSLGSITLGLLVFPLLITTMIGGNYSSSMVLFFLHPFYVIGQLANESEINFSTSSGQFIPDYYYCIPHIFTYLFLSIVFVNWAIQTLYFAENEVKFLPKAKTNA